MQSKVTSGLTPLWFTPEGQGLPEEDQRSYQYKPMDGWQSIEIVDHFYNGKLTKEGVRISVKEGLIGWKNVIDKNTGEPADFDIAAVGHAPTDELILLAYEITAVSYLTGEERKN